jgi:hypothetical protein
MLRSFRWTILVLAAVVLAAGIVFADPEYLRGHDTGYRWTSSYWPTIHDLNSSYGSYVTAAAADYNSNTQATVYTCSSSGCGSWDSLDAGLGSEGPYARTTLYISGSTITSALTEWNYNVSQPNRDHVARHEIGHGFGMDHVPCSPDAVMWGACSQPWPSSLQSHDIGHINDWY